MKIAKKLVIKIAQNQPSDLKKELYINIVNEA
jgi:hypothetical protein